MATIRITSSIPEAEKYRTYIQSLNNQRAAAEPKYIVSKIDPMDLVNMTRKIFRDKTPAQLVIGSPRRNALVPEQGEASFQASSPEHTENRPTRRMTAQGNNEKEPPKPLPHPAAPPRPPRPDGRQNLPGAHGSPGNCRKMRSVLFDADDQTQPGNYTQIRAAFKEKVEAADMAGLVEVMRLDC